MRRGFTLLEVLIAITLMAIVTAAALPRWSRVQDRLAVARASSRAASFYHVARYAAIMRAQRVRLEFGATELRAVYEGVRDSVFLRWPGPAQDGVALAVSRPVIRIAANGLGHGAANTRLILRRGAAADTLTTSRLGRLKRW